MPTNTREYMREYKHRRRADPRYREAENAYQREYVRRRFLDPSYRDGRRVSDRKNSRKYQLKRRYGLSVADADILLLRGCGICSASDDLVIDHVHNGKPNVRGVLCRKCNLGIGAFEPNPYLLLAAFRYLCPDVLESADLTLT
jgi:hypothetical protein